MLVAEMPSWCCFHMFLLVFAKRGLLDYTYLSHSYVTQQYPSLPLVVASGVMSKFRSVELSSPAHYITCHC